MYVWEKVWLWIPRRKRVENANGHQERRWIWGPLWRRPSAAREGAYVYSYAVPKNRSTVESLPL